MTPGDTPPPVVHAPEAGGGFLRGVVFEWLGRAARESDEGAEGLGTGVMFRDAGGRAIAWTDERWLEAGALLFAVAGLSHRPEARATGACGLGSRVELVPEPENPFDPRAVAVRCPGGGVQLGYVPRALNEALRTLLGGPAAAIVFFEWRGPGGEALGLRCLAGPEPFVARLERFVARRAG